MYIFTLLILIVSLPTSLSAYHDSKPSLGIDAMHHTANKVLNDLKRAKGILPNEAPILKVFRFRGDGKLAIMHLDKGEIHLDSKSFLTCRRMGSDSLNALAFLLGHELGHFINAHGGVNHNLANTSAESFRTFESVSSPMSLSRAPEAVNFQNRMSLALEQFQETHDEAEADFEGAFLGYLAGYEPIEAGRQFLMNAYAEFKLDSITVGYPSLSERLTILENTAKDVAKLSPIFEAAQYLLALGQYGDVVPLLERILEKFESPEIYNNLAVSMALDIQSIFDIRITKFLLPLTYDVSFRAPHPQVFLQELPDEYSTETNIGFPPCEANILHFKLDEAEDVLKKAIFLDEDYALAYLNLSIIRTLKAELYSTEYQKLFREPRARPSNCLQPQWDEYVRALGDAMSARKYGEELSKKGVLQRHLLSNIWTQIDLLRISLNQDNEGFLTYVDERSRSQKIPKPIFSRALQLNSNNIYALRNRAIYNKEQFIHPYLDTTFRDPCDKVELINEEPIY